MNHDQFLDTYGTRTGRYLANRLNLSGKGSEGLANLISCYAWNRRAAECCAGIAEMKGKSRDNAYFDYCLRLKAEIQSHPLFSLVQRRISFW